MTYTSKVSPSHGRGHRFNPCIAHHHFNDLARVQRLEIHPNRQDSAYISGTWNGNPCEIRAVGSGDVRPLAQPQGTVSHAHVADAAGCCYSRATVLPGVVTGGQP
jgi:hypothetical protein